MNQQLLGASNDQTDPTYTAVDTTGVSGSDDDDIKITARDIILQPFFKGDEEAMPSADQSDDLARHHGKNDIFNSYLIAINAYLSTPKFIMTLTDLSLELIAQPNRGEFLQAELKKINHKLPAAVYLPFVNGNSFLTLKFFRFNA